jgi:outer membrane receptor protein involved in Fe transport
LLADSYSALPRHEIARVSELLQSQLLQPINLTPVQPSLAESNLLILEGAGPSAPAFNEFNPLFTRNRLALQTSAVVGSNKTLGDEVVHSGVWDNFSYSLGQFHYETEGFRENNDLRQDIYNAFVQMNLTPKVSLQVEGRHRELEHGDILFKFHDPRFDRAPFSDTFRKELIMDTVRLGAHLSLSPASDLISSVIFQNTETQNEATTQGYIAEAQYLFRAPFWNIVLGGGYYASDETTRFQTINEFPECSETTFIDSEATACNVSHGNSYAYFHTQYPSNITWTLGLSYDRLNDETFGLHLEKINPKAGLSWHLTPNTALRLAAFRALKRSLFSDQTLEPTHVGGFNQFYDDRNGTLFWRYGIALDHKFSSNLFAGLELSKRELEVLIAGAGVTNKDEWEENLYRGYIYWAPAQKWSLNLSFEYEVFRNLGTELIELIPGKLTVASALSTETLYLPIALSYYHPSGLFGRVKATYANQTLTEVNNGDDFMIADAALGFRLPKRLGIITLEARNLFDEQFNFEDTFARSSTQDTVSLPFLPERSIFAKLSLAF